MYREYTRNWILALFNANKTPTEIVTILREENIVDVKTTVARIIRRTRGKKARAAASRPPWTTTKSQFIREEENRRGLQAGS